jgi:hypothetical protein
MKPLEQRMGKGDMIEGLCHQCRRFVPACNGKKKNNYMLWYRHAHKVCKKKKKKKRVSQLVHILISLHSVTCMINPRQLLYLKALENYPMTVLLL